MMKTKPGCKYLLKDVTDTQLAFMLLNVKIKLSNVKTPRVQHRFESAKQSFLSFVKTSRVKYRIKYQIVSDSSKTHVYILRTEQNICKTSLKLFKKSQWNDN